MPNIYTEKGVKDNIYLENHQKNRSAIKVKLAGKIMNSCVESLDRNIEEFSKAIAKAIMQEKL